MFSFTIIVLCSRFTAGDSALVTTTKSASAAQQNKSLVSLEAVTMRYQTRDSCDSHYGQEMQKGAVILSLRYNDEATKLVTSLSDGRSRILNLPDWNDPSAGTKVSEMVLADEEVVYPNTSPATTANWCPHKRNQVQGKQYQTTSFLP